MSRSISESPLEFEIRRVDCTLNCSPWISSFRMSLVRVLLSE